MLPGMIPSIGMSAAGGVVDTTYQIARSLRFRAPVAGYLVRTLGTPTNATTYTFSTWLKLGNISAVNQTVIGRFNGTFGTGLIYNSGVTNAFQFNNTTGTPINIPGVYRDPSAHYHVVFNFNGTTLNIWINNSLLLSTTTTIGEINAAGQPVGIGILYGLGYSFDGYLSETLWIDGQALTPSAFGAVNGITGAWNPQKYLGTYGNNGFYLDYSDNSAATATALGKDRSGNNNNWTPTNISVTAGITNDSLTDTPSNYGTDTGVGGEVRGNYATFSPLWASTNTTWTSGGLRATAGANGNNNASICPFGMFPGSGKWVFECYNTPASTIFKGLGVTAFAASGPSSLTATVAVINDPSTIEYDSGGTIYKGGASQGSFTPWSTSGDTIRIECNCSGNTPSFAFYSRANALVATIAGTAGATYFPYLDIWSNGYCDLNFGQRPWTNAPTAGFKALCTQNLPDPVIKNPAKYFDGSLRTGTGAAFNVTGKGFQPDLIWIKGRNNATAHAIYDSARGVQKDFEITATVETTQAQGITVFNADGFSGGTLAKINTNTATYVDLAWKKGVLPGLDIVNFTGTGVQTINHALGAVPEMMIVKERQQGDSFYIYHKYGNATPQNGAMYFEGTQAWTASPAYFNNTVPTTTQFSVGSNLDSTPTVAYLFTPVLGFSRFSSYVGNGSADGPFVWCGFRPRWLMLKRSDSTSHWSIFDAMRAGYNPNLFALLANLSIAETGFNTGIDFTSNGFKLRDSDTNINISGGTYIYAAFAESPFKYARAR